MSSEIQRSQGSSHKYDVVFTDKTDNSLLSQSDFMKLMVTQMQNQDFTNPMDNSQMITQMTQFSNMQQMQEMASYSKTNYAMSMVGKTVTASRFTVGGELDTTTGTVDKISLVDNEYVAFVGGKKYTLAQIMGIQNGSLAEGTSPVNPQTRKLSATDVKSDSAVLNWEVPTEDEMLADSLKYTVYYSKEGPFDTLAAVESGKLAGAKEQKALTKESLNELEPDTVYYANVVVKDENGVKTIYKPIEIRTKKA